MSVRDIERALWREAKVVAKNPKLRQKDITEWTSGSPSPTKDEIVLTIRYLDMDWSVCLLKEHDKRTDEERKES